MPLPILNVFNSPHLITAAEAAAGTYITQEVLQGPCIMVGLSVANANRATARWDAYLCKRGKNAPEGITIFQYEYQRFAGSDIVWGGRMHIPKDWLLTICHSECWVAGDQLYIHGGYESWVADQLYRGYESWVVGDQLYIHGGY